ncbi:MAG: phosphohydrolase [Archangium gephyra]|uniref:Phosphohydrolase n=1 Tax=Archangium gephyra TaxID=48 RepID=A0A2W5TPR4_9BACT|nr:MAG: phosphohydrolase [Archangium gephyra]
MVPWIQTHSGRAVDPINTHPGSLAIEDIAHALSLVNRYTGHTSKPYSVGRHSMTVARLVKMRGGSQNAQLLALLHDATEAYLSDIASPVKQHAIFDGYRAAEAKLADVIWQRFGTGAVGERALQLVKQADADMLLAERKNVLPAGAWKLTEVVPRDACEAFVWGCQFKAHEVVRAVFLMMFDALGGNR